MLAAGVGPTGLLFASATTPTLARYVCSGIYRLRPAATEIEGAQAAGETVTSFAFDPLDPLLAYASARWFNPYGPVALFRTSDGGDSWQPFDRGLEGQRINRVVVNRSGQRLYALSIDGQLFALDRESSPQGGERRSLRRIPARP